MVDSKYPLTIWLSIHLILHCNFSVAESNQDQSHHSYHYNPAAQTAYAGWEKNDQYLCGGYYIRPQFHSISDDANWEVSADHIEIKQPGSSRLTGHVWLKFGQRYFFADTIELQSSKQQIENVKAYGDLQYLDSAMQIYGISGVWDAKQDTLTIEEPSYTYFERHARGQAQSISLLNRNFAEFTDAMYTTCAPDKTTWALQGSHISLNRETGRGSAKNIRLKVKDKTVFYWPYLQFPIDNRRHSGFLFPQAGSTTQSGIEFSIPYYWNIAPNYDLTFTPRILTNRGVDLQNEFRYLSQHTSGTIKLHVLPNDKKYRDFRRDNLLNPPIQAPLHDPRITALHSGNHRVGFSFENLTYFNTNWWLDVDYTHVGDDNYFYDLENDLGSASTTKLAQTASLHYLDDHWQHVLRVQSFDLLHPLLGPVNSQDYRQLPTWHFYGYYPKIYQFDLSIDGEITHFRHPTDPITGLRVTDGTRYYLRPTLGLPTVKWWGFVKPSVSVDLLSDNLNRSQSEQLNHQPAHVSRVIPIVDLDAGLFFDKYFSSGYQQTLEPRLYYLYVPNKNQNDFPIFDTSHIDFSYYQMFRKNRFSGRDRLGDTHQTTLALTSRLLNQQGDEKLRVSLGEIFYFKERAVTLCAPLDAACQLAEDQDRDRHFSPLIASLMLSPSNHWLASFGIEWNPNHNDIEKGYASLEYTPGFKQAISLNYYWMSRNPYEEQIFLIEKPLNQASVGLFWPISKQFDMLGHYRYDFENNRMIELLAGLEYDTCCLSFQMVGNRTLRPNDGLSPVEYANGIFFQVLFKGLSNVGSRKADSKLKKTIPTYSSFAKRNDFGKKANQSI